MKIQVGVGNKKDFLYFLDAGADELYAGIKDIPGHLYGGENLSSLDEAMDFAAIARKRGKKFFLVANEVRSDCLKKTVDMIDAAVSGGIDGIIVRDISLLEELKKKKIKTHYILSSLVLCFNSRTLKFYADLGIKRLALPEQLTVKEALPLVKNRWKIETEVFLTAREYCVVLNGFCYLKQFNGNCICRAPFKFENSVFAMPRFAVKEHFENLYDFYSMGVETIKIGRHPHKDYGKFIFKEVLGMKALLKKAKNKEDFAEKAMILHNSFTEFLKEWKKRI